MKEFINKYFQKMGKTFCSNMEVILPAMLKCGSSNTSLIAREMEHFTNQNFKANDVKLYRFLQNKNFQIDEKFWRCHVNLIFDYLEEQELIKKGENIPINIDLTSCKRDFLILSASVMVKDKAICLYFSTRNYPPKGYKMSQKNMEKAFINMLRQLLSKNYNYTIVADRGYGNLRFINLCEQNNFNYVIRINHNINFINKENKIQNLQDFVGKNEEFEAKIKKWNKHFKITVKTENNKTWFLLSNNQKNVIEIYKNRFKIEKLFQDQKSSGFDIENTKIKKYDRFKRLLYLISLSHSLITFLGNIINDKKLQIKKNSFYI